MQVGVLFIGYAIKSMMDIMVEAAVQVGGAGANEQTLACIAARACLQLRASVIATRTAAAVWLPPHAHAPARTRARSG